MDARIDYYREQLDEINRLCEEGEIANAIDLSGRVERDARAEEAAGLANFFAGEFAALTGNVRKGARLQVLAAEAMTRVPFILGNCAVLLSMAGKPKQAVEMLDRVLELEPKNLQALGQKGVSLAKMGYDDLALESFEAILALDPGQHHALRNKAVSLSRLGFEKEALEIFDAVLKENPQDKHARSERAILLDEMHLRGTPLGWLLLWLRKRLGPALMRIRYRLPRPVEAG